MRLRRLKFVCCTALLSTINACSIFSGGGARSVRAIELTQDALVSGDKLPKAVLKKGSRIELKDDAPITVEWPGFRAAVIIPVSDQVEPTRVTLKPLEGAGVVKSDQSRQRIGIELNRLIAKVNEVQWLSATKHTDLALKTLEDLESVYPDVTYLGFMRASLLLMRGDQQKAIAALEGALREFPENESGQNLYRKLSGNERKTKTRGSSSLLDDDLLDMSTDNMTLDTTSTPGAAAPPMSPVDAAPVVPRPMLAMPQLLAPPAPVAPPLPQTLGKLPTASPKAPTLPLGGLPAGAEEAFGDEL